jgi:predicted RND superfamily exporter protein
MKEKRLSWLVLAGFGLLLGISLVLASRQRFAYSFDKYFPYGDERLEFYLAYQDTFGTDYDWVLIGMANEEGIFDQDFLRKVQRLTDTLQANPLITRVTSPTEWVNRIVHPLGMIEEPVLHPEDPSRYAADSANIYQSHELVNTLFSPDRKSVLMIAETQEKLRKSQGDSLLAQLEGQIAQMQFDESAIAGKIKMDHDLISRMLEETFTTFALSFALVVLVLFFTFRSFWGIWIPAVTVVSSVAMTLAVMVLFGRQLSLIDTMLPTFLFIVGMSDSIHLLSKYLDELRLGRDKVTALRKAWRETVVATAFTSFTTALGFFTLSFTPVEPIRQFGYFTALGVMIAYVLSFTFIPAVLLIMRTPRIKGDFEAPFWRKRLRRSFMWLVRHKIAIVAVFGAAFLAGGIGTRFIHVNRYYLDDLSKNDPLRVNHRFFESRFGGIKPFEMAVTVADTSKDLFDPAIQQDLAELQGYLETEMHLTSVTGPQTLMMGANKALRGGMPQDFALPERESDWKQARKILRSESRKGNLRNVVSRDLRHGRLRGKGPDTGSYLARIEERKLEAFVAARIDTTQLQLRHTGATKLVDDQNQNMSLSLMEGLLLDFLLISVIAALMFRSWRMAILALVPNVFPLFVLAGIMGFAGIDLKFTTAMVYSVVFGISVDDTVHMLSKLRHELKSGKSLPYAMKRSYLTTGKATVMTSIILMGGYLTTLASSFEGIFYTGLLVSLALFSALLADLYLLSVLLFWFFRKEAERFGKRYNGK